MKLRWMWALFPFVLACGDDGGPYRGPDGAGGGPVTGTGGAATGGTGAGAAGASGGAGGQGAQGGQGGGGGQGAGPQSLDDLLDDLRTDPGATLLGVSRTTGWPPLTDQGYLVVTTDASFDQVPGDHDGWMGTPLTTDQGFSWAVIDASPGDGYKLSDGSLFEADPWARAYDYDLNGELSLVLPNAAHLERHFVDGGTLLDRRLRVWVPSGSATHVLYVHDGQNLFDPNAIWGGWNLQTSVPPNMLVVGIENTADRFDEYTHVPDDIGSVVGGGGDEYADWVEGSIRPLIDSVYGEPPIIGIMGSSLGGLISLHTALRHPGRYDFAASLSGTLGWGSMTLQNETMIERWQSAGLQSTAVYLDSGGSGNCVDSDGDGIEDDDPNALDNYCETNQMRDVLAGVGYTFDLDLWHWYEAGAPHNEAAWAARVWRPLDIFAAL